MLNPFNVAVITPATFFAATVVTSAEKAGIERNPRNMNVDSMLLYP